MTTLNQVIEEGLTETAERIVIDYANFSGRGDFRGELRESIIKHFRIFAGRIYQEAYQQGLDSVKECYLQGYRSAREEVIEEIEKELEHWTDNYQNWKTRIGSSDLTEATFKVEALADLLKALKEK